METQDVLVGGYGHHRGHGYEKLILREVTSGKEQAARAACDLQSAIGTSRGDTLERIAASRCDVLGAVKDASCAGVSATKDARADILAGGAAASAALTGTVSRLGYDLSQELSRGFAAGAVADCHTVERMGAGFAAAQRDLCDVAKDVTAVVQHGTEKLSADLCGTSREIAQASKEVALGFKDQIIEANKNVQILSTQSERIGNALSVQATMYANNATVQVERVRAELGAKADQYAAAAELSAVKFAAAAELRAQQIAAEAARQLAECCCELKELTREQAGQTRSLIEANEKDRLREQLSDAKAQLAAKACCDPCGDRGRRGSSDNISIEMVQIMAAALAGKSPNSGKG